MNKNFIGIFMILLVIFFSGTVQLRSESKSDNFKLICDVLDESSGKSQSSHFVAKISSSGQPSPIGEGTSSHFKARGGYVYSASVLHGDANGGGLVEVGDIAYLINYLYRGGPPPLPFEAGDVNCDGIINISDVAYLTNYLYRAGAPPCDPPIEMTAERVRN